MIAPQTPMASAPTSLTRRVIDLLVIVAMAGGLLGLAWRVARERGRGQAAPPASSLEGPQLPEAAELQLRLPLEKFGMVLTREPVEGDSQQALVALEQRCKEVLAVADEWVLSLAVSPEEQLMLDSLVGAEPLPSPLDQPLAAVRLFPLTQPTGRAGIREPATRNRPLTPALSPIVESSQTVEPIVGERGQEEQRPSNDSGPSAAAGRRLICWGFIVSNGAGGHTVWFARPRDKRPRSDSQKGHDP